MILGQVPNYLFIIKPESDNLLTNFHDDQLQCLKYDHIVHKDVVIAEG